MPRRSWVWGHAGAVSLQACVRRRSPATVPTQPEIGGKPTTQTTPPSPGPPDHSSQVLRVSLASKPTFTVGLITPFPQMRGPGLGEATWHRVPGEAGTAPGAALGQPPSTQVQGG